MSWKTIFRKGILVEDVKDCEFTPIYNHPGEPINPVTTDRGTYDPKNSLNDLTGREWVKFTRSWFVHRPPPRDPGMTVHPAKFPEDLIEKFVRFFTKEGQWVLDPFVGTGSTIVACENTRRNGIGIELTRKWAEIAATRSQGYIILGDARQIPKMNIPPIHLCISSPPYWDMLHHSRGGSKSTHKKRANHGLAQTFSQNPRDLGNVASYDQFKRDLLGIYAAILPKMATGAYCVVFLQNILKPDGFYPLAWEFALGMREFGWILHQEMIWCQRDKKLGCWGVNRRYVSNVHHHYALVFQVTENVNNVEKKEKKDR